MNKILFRSIEYAEYRFQKSTTHIRLLVLAFAFSLGLASIYDISISSDYLIIFNVVRFGIVIPFFILVFALSFLEMMSKYYQVFISSAFLLTGLSLIINMMLEPNSYHFYAIFGIVLMIFILFFEMDVLYVIVSTATLNLMYHIVSIAYLSVSNEFTTSIAIFYLIISVLLILSHFRNEIRAYEDYEYGASCEIKNSDLEKEIISALSEVETTQRITIEALASLAETKDKTTSEHLERVGFLCKSIAELLPVSYYYSEKYTKEEYANNIESASLLHDIGKIGVVPTILNKPGPLTSDERKDMEQHTLVGYETLRRINKKFPDNQLIHMGIEIARSHHENWDGTGYPDQLSKYDIPLSARIVSIVDVFDALISERPYKIGFSYEETIRIMKSLKSSKFDPKLLEYFFKLLNRKDVKRIINL